MYKDEYGIRATLWVTDEKRGKIALGYFLLVTRYMVVERLSYIGV